MTTDLGCVFQGPDALQDMFGHLGCQGHIQLAVSQNPQIPSVGLFSASHPLAYTYSQSCSVPAQNPVRALVHLHAIGDYLTFRLCIQGLCKLKGVNSFSKFSIICKLLVLYSKSFMKTLKRTGQKMEPCRTPLVTSCQPDITPINIGL